MARIQLVWKREGPQVDPILVINGGHDGFVSLSRKNESGAWEELPSVRADKLASMFPAFRGELMRDSYYTVNAFWKDNGRNRKWPNLGAPYRKTGGLRYLNACFADVDCYKVGLDHMQMCGILLSAQSKGYIPRVSLIVRSGCGVWLFWLLVDPRNPGTPPRAWREKVAQWSAIQKAIHDRLAVCGADARDAARVTRVPESIHMGTNLTVTYAWQCDAKGRLPAYTLDDMARALDLTHSASKGQAKRRGWVALQRGRLQQFEQLRAMRDGFSEGCRNRALMLYVVFMLKNGFGQDAIMDNASRFGAECHPPLSEREIRGAVASAQNAKQPHRRFTDQTISDWLQISPKESALLETWGPASCFRSTAIAAEKRPTRYERMKARRDAITKIVGQADRVPSVREMVTILREQYSESASHVTVEADYHALTLVSESEAKRRKRELGSAR
jgi:hypothetical protein